MDEFGEEIPDIPNREPPPIPRPAARARPRPLPSQPTPSTQLKPVTPNIILSQSAPTQPHDTYFQRGKIIQELILTEEVYVHGLHKIIEEYKKPLLAPDSPLPPEVVLKIFSNIEEIHRFNVVLLEEMKRAFPDTQNIHGSECLGSFFIQLASFLKLYNTYCENHTQSTSTLGQLEKNPSFVSFLQKVQLKQGTMLPDLLSRPIQRICKYPLLFRELLKATPQVHRDYNNVKLTLEKLEKIAAEVNQYKENAESFKKFLEFSANVIGFVPPPADKIVPTLIHDEHLITGESNNRTERKEYPRRVYLFSDSIIFTKPSTIPNKEEQTNTVDIKSVIDVKAHPESKTMFELEMTVGTIFCICPSFASRTLWITKLQSAIKGEVNRELSVKVHNSSKLPLKQKTGLPRRPTNLDQIPKLANFLALNLMDSPQYALVLPNAFERKEFLSDIILLNYLQWIFEYGELWYMWQESGDSVRALSGWVGRDVALEVPLSIKIDTYTNVWTRFSFGRAQVLKAFSAALEDWLTKHRPPGSVLLALVAADRADSEGLSRIFEKVRRVRFNDFPIWTYTFVQDFGQNLQELGFIQHHSDQLIIEDVGVLPIFSWLYPTTLVSPRSISVPQKDSTTPRLRPKSEPL